VAEASDFKLGAQLGFAKAHHKIAHMATSGLGPWKLTKICGSP